MSELLQKRPGKWRYYLLLALWGLFVVGCVVAWGLASSKFSGTQADAKVVAAAIALVGVLFTGTATLFGVLLKNAVEERNQKRLALDSAVQAIRILTTETGGEAPPSPTSVLAAIRSRLLVCARER